MTLLALPNFADRESKTASVTNAAVVALAGFSFTVPHADNARRATITNGAVAVRFTSSPTNPTATLGRYLAANETVIIYGKEDIKNVKFLSTAGDSVVTVTLGY
jgi:hypothetical protein